MRPKEAPFYKSLSDDAFIALYAPSDVTANCGSLSSMTFQEDTVQILVLWDLPHWNPDVERERFGNMLLGYRTIVKEGKTRHYFAFPEKTFSCRIPAEIKRNRRADKFKNLRQKAGKAYAKSWNKDLKLA